MQTLGRKLDTKLAEWKPTTSSQVRTLVEEIVWSASKTLDTHSQSGEDV
ncbi:MAG: hypothetical protein H3C58_03645 [Fimbriimonadaceae bacterium]|nr:hypothetical protein [Fimbriimonadaceae bacterium]